MCKCGAVEVRLCVFYHEDVSPFSFTKLQTIFFPANVDAQLDSGLRTYLIDSN